jgi:DUF4097 and DUF4098 domain-containing protein YvlB
MINVKRMTIFALILLLIGVLGIAALTFLSSVGNNEMQSKEIKISDEEFNHVNITTDDTEVHILPANDPHATVEFSKNRDTYDVHAEIEGDTLAISAEAHWISWFNFDFLFPTSSMLTLHLPEELYDSLQIETSNGRIQVDNMQTTDINLKTSNGQIRVSNTESSAITTTTSNGRVILEDVKGDIFSEASNGRITLEDVEGNLSAKTSNGQISLVTEHLDRPIDFETSNGRIHIQTDNEPANTILDVQTDNGEVTIFGSSNWDTVVGNGDNLIKLRTNNGRVLVEK